MRKDGETVAERNDQTKAKNLWNIPFFLLKRAMRVLYIEIMRFRQRTVVILKVIHVYFTLTGLKTTWIEDFLPATLELWILRKDIF